MLVKYYKNKDLSYANRKRFLTFNFTHFYEEEQKSILLGDGANTQIKTSKSNICDYVAIDDTRWFVTSYVYCNGGQVILNLQRDVIGEMGLENCFGKIERGYTDSVIRNRKELGLNQVLKERKKLRPVKNNYGEYSVDNHENEMWGIIYVSKPNDGADNININIPEFTPKELQYDFIENGTMKYTGSWRNPFVKFTLGIKNTDFVFLVRVEFFQDYENKCWNYFGTLERVENIDVALWVELKDVKDNQLSFNNETDLKSAISGVIKLLGNYVISIDKGAGKLPDYGEFDENVVDYNGFIVKKDDVYYKYSTEEVRNYARWGSDPDIRTVRHSIFNPSVNYKTFSFKTSYGNNIEVKYVLTDGKLDNSYPYRTYEYFEWDGSLMLTAIKYTYEVVDESEGGTFAIDVSQQLVDEPFSIFVCPLYSVKLYGEEDFNISKTNAFNVFNTVIQSLSGDNGYIVDAQIYPYCPVLTGVSFKIKGIPFFSIASTSYYHDCVVDLRPDADVKKEYIKRLYSIVSPEKTGKFDFNFYDYKTKITDYNGVNTESLVITIKTALKPFSIISSAVIVPDGDSLRGLKYDSDLRGCQPSGNGFQCSLASNAFETYKRQNSNYQQIFSLQKEELALSHSTERVNEITNGIVSTTTATLMGTMAGAATADGFWGNLVHAKAAGATVGGVAAGATVGVSQSVQLSQNDKLRDFEKRIQQQMFDLQIGTIKNIPNSINRISSFNEIILKDFCYIVEVYECTESEKRIVDNFISRYSYGIGVFDFISNYVKDKWFVRSTLVSSSYPPNLHNVASNELMGGIYIYE